jgi:pimeloyl-ACP methyl ester carboxylesterase
MGMRTSRIRLGGDCDGLALGFTDWGDPEARRTIVCVHGLTRNARDFDLLASALSRHARVICIDVVGRGLSDWLNDPKDYDIQVYARHIRRLLDRLGRDRVDWVGTSMGGLIGMLIAASDDSPIDRLILNDIGPTVPQEALQIIAGYLGLDLSFQTIEALEKHLRQIHAPFGPLTDPQWRHLAEHSARADGSIWRLHYDPLIRVPFVESAGKPVDLWEAWDRIRCPTHVLHGAQSVLLVSETVAAMRERGPRADVLSLPGIGHAPALMADDQIATIGRWLDLE